MYDYVYMIVAFVKFLNEPPVILCLSWHPGEISSQVEARDEGSANTATEGQAPAAASWNEHSQDPTTGVRSHNFDVVVT